MSGLLRSWGSSLFGQPAAPSYARYFSASARRSEKYFDKILVANRGEIACRVMRTCKRLGIRTVAIYSEPDATALHVRMADEAYCVGPAASSQSYLNMNKILDVIKKTGAQAVHPGYGFLSENAEFAERCAAAGILFIGPTPDAIRSMGSKIEAKKLLAGREDIPLIPGTVEAVGDARAVEEEARRLGLPVLLKASAGGGGKGMRVVRELGQLAEAVSLAQKEAQSSFGDPALLLEKYFEDVKHIEVQIVGDEQGNVMHLFERECSVQRRHQKVVEEAPSSSVDEELRQRMTAAAVAIGRVMGYLSLGTVEFILDRASRRFYFLEVNTRLQVEHPVTEAITGFDLVRLQLDIARGKSLYELGVDRATISGHSLEARLYAEDPNNSFFPCTGTVHKWTAATVPGVRYDTGIEDGSTISVFYDPLVSKVISHGRNREQATLRLEQALRDTVALGVTTNRLLLLQVLRHSAFVDGSFTTGFIDQYLDAHKRAEEEELRVRSSREEMAVAAMLFEWSHNEQRRTLLRNLPSGWRNNPYCLQQRAFRFPDGMEAAVEYRHSRARGGPHTFLVKVGKWSCDCVELLRHEGPTLAASIGGVRKEYHAWVTPAGEIFLHAAHFGNVSLSRVSRFRIDDSERDSDDGELVAQMPARILEVLVDDCQQVEKDQPLLVIESMKMQTRLSASKAGVARVYVQVGQLVEAGSVMVAVEAAKKE
mmetsp:Transcript_6738/g.28235  ORF Transcript_6738/g.28235 Transcript_6738/m.28235 type:complete len:710 (+) Transcript_6738:35-2164(+)